jgi:GNAT superfamily N-acetyltransferase
MPNRPYAAAITLRDGHAATPTGVPRVATVRPLEAGDVEPLTAYFLSLSADTKRRYGPHPFDRPTAEKLCASIDPAKGVRFVAVLEEGTPQAAIIGYMILSREIWGDDLRRYGATPRQPAAGERLPWYVPVGEAIKSVLPWGLKRWLWRVVTPYYQRQLPQPTQPDSLLPLAETACLAPSIADAYQSQGLGTQMAQHVLTSARAMGVRRLILMGGVQATNARARKLYERLGFRYVRAFLTHYGGVEMNNYDMIVDL